MNRQRKVQKVSVPIIVPVKFQAKQETEQEDSVFDDEERTLERESTEQNVGIFEDKEEVKANNNNLPEDEPTKLIRRGVMADKLPAAT